MKVESVCETSYRDGARHGSIQSAAISLGFSARWRCSRLLRLTSPRKQVRWMFTEHFCWFWREERERERDTAVESLDHSNYILNTFSDFSLYVCFKWWQLCLKVSVVDFWREERDLLSIILPSNLILRTHILSSNNCLIISVRKSLIFGEKRERHWYSNYILNRFLVSNLVVRVF